MEGAPSNQLGLLVSGTVPGAEGLSPSPSGHLPPNAESVGISSSRTFLPLALQEHRALLEKAREGEAALGELQSKNADCRAEQEK